MDNILSIFIHSIHVYWIEYTTYKYDALEDNTDLLFGVKVVRGYLPEEVAFKVRLEGVNLCFLGLL